MSAARVVILVLALVVCAWFLVGARANHDESVVNTLLDTHHSLTAAQAVSAEHRLTQAGFLNPDESLSTLRALVQTRAGQSRAALATARAVTVAHPRDLNAWLGLEYLANGGVDPALYRLAAAHAEALVPHVPAAP